MLRSEDFAQHDTPVWPLLSRIIHRLRRILRNGFQSNDLRPSYPFHRAIPERYRDARAMRNAVCGVLRFRRIGLLLSNIVEPGNT